MTAKKLKAQVLRLVGEWDDPEIFPSDVAKRLKIPYDQAQAALEALHREGRFSCERGRCDLCFNDRVRSKRTSVPLKMVRVWLIVDKKTRAPLLEEASIWSRGTPKLFTEKKWAQAMCGKQGTVVEAQIRYR